MDTLSALYLAKIYFPLSVLIIILFCHATSRNKQKNKLIKYGLLLTIIIILLTSVYSTILTYLAWKQDPISKFLLPPYNSSYFYQYAYFHYWRPSIIAFTVSAIWVLFLFFIKKYSNDKLISKNEIHLGFFTALSVGFPLFIPYLFILFTLFLFHQLINSIIFKKHQPILISLSMIVSAITVILLGDSILIKFGLDVLKV